MGTAEQACLSAGLLRLEIPVHELSPRPAQAESQEGPSRPAEVKNATEIVVIQQLREQQVATWSLA